MSLEEFCDLYVRGDKAVIKHRMKYRWLSGSSTEVYPITIWGCSRTIDIQWNVRDGRTVRGFIKRMESHPEVEYAYYKRNDGSCPSEVVVKILG